MYKHGYLRTSSDSYTTDKLVINILLINKYNLIKQLKSECSLNKQLLVEALGKLWLARRREHSVVLRFH